ncbi:MAG: PilZ domain-containing protein [Acidimicrobiales bacterium]|jgi:hypothetical protein
MNHQLRRLLPRQFADWGGAYLIEDEPERRWRDCRVIDISSAGAGVELIDAPWEASAGNHILIAVHLRGEIRHTGPSQGDRLRIGTQFVGLTDAQGEALASFESVEARW